MQSKSVRTSIDIPQDLHRKLYEMAARKGCSARQLILNSIENAIAVSGDQRPRKRLSLDPPIVPSTGKPIVVTEDQIYVGLDFP